jgi:hypothetical protein
VNTRRKNHSWKVVTVRRGYKEDPDVARERHYAAHPDDRDADVVIWNFFDDKRTIDESAE